MRIIHTADWHLGQQFHGYERLYEQQCFLNWLHDLIVQRDIDALLIAGDIFDVASPSVRAQRLLYDFIVKLHAAMPHLTLVMIAGNHDSGARIELPASLMRSLHAHALGRLHWCSIEGGERQPDLDALCVPLPDRNGNIRAWCLAMPFLRPSEVCQHPLEYREKTADLHQRLCKRGIARREGNAALIAMAHLHLHGGNVSEDSERPIVVGGEEALPASVFPQEIDYVALGHLHRAQQVGASHVRYAGSPYPLDFSERNYRHQVIELALQDDVQPIQQIVHEVPVSVPMEVVGPVPLDALSDALDTLPLPDNRASREHWPWLQVCITLDAPRPDLRYQVERLLTDRPLRLVSLTVVHPGASHDNDDTSPPPHLESLGPSGLFSLRWEKQFGAPPAPEVLDDFAWLMQKVQDRENL